MCQNQVDFIRAESNCICTVCGKYYWQHPDCPQSALPEDMQSSSVTTDYMLNVLCDGTHVKL